MHNHHLLFLRIHKAYHPENPSFNFEILKVLEVIQRLQELALIVNYYPNSLGMSGLYQIIDAMDFYKGYDAAFSIFILGVNFSVVSLTLLQTKSITFQKLLTFILIIYHQVLVIPIILSNLLVSSSIFIFSGILNFIIFEILSIMHSYFARADRLQDGNSFLKQNHYFTIQLLLNISLQISVFLYYFDVLIGLRYVVFIFRTIIRLFSNIKYQNMHFTSTLDIFSLIIVVNLLFELTFFDLLLLLVICVYFYLQIHEQILIALVFSKNQLNIPILLVLHQMRNLHESKHVLMLHVILRNHECTQCKRPEQLILCLSKRMLSNHQILIIHCSELQQYIKSYIRLCNYGKSRVLYHRIAQQNLAAMLLHKANLQQIEQNELYRSKLNSESIALESRTVFYALNTFDQIFEQFQKTLISKQQFWAKLINGFQNLYQYRTVALDTSHSIEMSKVLVTRLFNLQQYHLRYSEQSDILSLRILQIYFTAIYPNQQEALQIEQLIQEILTRERFKQDDSLDNLQLLNTRVVSLSSSMIINRGNLMNINLKQLAKFMDRKEQEMQSIQHVNQLLPQFIANIHAGLMDNYVQNGYSSMIIKGTKTFYKDMDSYIIPCKMDLFNSYSIQDDLVIHGILSKELNPPETVIFGVDGTIYGISKQFFEETSRTMINVGDLLQGGLIQYYLSGIVESVQQLRNQVNDQQNLLLPNLRGVWDYPSQHSQCINQTDIILCPFRKRKANELLQSHRSSRFTVTETDFDYIPIVESMKQQISIQNTPILMLHPELMASIEQINSNYKNSNIIKGFDIAYTLSYSQLKTKTQTIGYFIITLKDFKDIQINNFKTRIGYSSQTQSNFQDYVSEIVSLNISKEQLAMQPNMTNFQSLDQRYQILSAQDGFDFTTNVRIKSGETFHVFDSTRIQQQQPFFVNPQTNLVSPKNEDLQLIEEEMAQLQDPPDSKELASNDNNEKRSSKSQSRQQDLIDKIILKKQDEIGIINNEASIESKTSTTSSSKENLKIVQQLYYNSQLCIPLRRISFILFLILSTVVVSVSYNISTINSTLYDQRQSLNKIYQPQIMNFIMLSYYYQPATVILYNLGRFPLSPYYKYWNEQNLYEAYVTARPQMNSLILTMQIQGNQMQKTIYDNKTQQLQTYNVTVTEFYSQMNEIFEILQRSRLNDPTYSFSEYDFHAYMRLNLINMIKFQDQLIQDIMLDTQNGQKSIKTTFSAMMGVEMAIAIFFILIQMLLWIDLDSIQKSVILLVTRLNEEQAMEQQIRLYQIQQLCVDNQSNKWKQKNYFQMMFDAIQTKKKQIDRKKVTILFNRFQQTNYYNQNNMILTFALIVIWIAFLVSGYLVHMSRNDQFEPSLTATLTYSKFRHNIDATVLLGAMMKIEQFLPFNISQVNQSETITEFIYFSSTITPLIDNIFGVITEAANGADTIFDDVFTEDLCNIYPEILTLCNRSIEVYPMEDYTDTISNGIIGYVQSFQKYINSDFDYEVTNLKYSPLNDMLTKPYNNFILGYVLDILETFVSVVDLFTENNTNIANSISTLLTIYYIGLGMMQLNINFSLALLFSITAIVWILIAHRTTKTLSQILVMIPAEQIQNSNIRSTARDIHHRLY